MFDVLFEEDGLDFGRVNLKGTMFEVFIQRSVTGLEDVSKCEKKHFWKGANFT